MRVLLVFGGLIWLGHSAALRRLFTCPTPSPLPEAYASCDVVQHSYNTRVNTTCYCMDGYYHTGSATLYADPQCNWLISELPACEKCVIPPNNGTWYIREVLYGVAFIPYAVTWVCIRDGSEFHSICGSPPQTDVWSPPFSCPDIAHDTASGTGLYTPTTTPTPTPTTTGTATPTSTSTPTQSSSSTVSITAIVSMTSEVSPSHTPMISSTDTSAYTVTTTASSHKSSSGTMSGSASPSESVTMSVSSTCSVMPSFSASYSAQHTPLPYYTSLITSSTTFTTSPSYTSSTSSANTPNASYTVTPSHSTRPSETGSNLATTSPNITTITPTITTTMTSIVTRTSSNSASKLPSPSASRSPSSMASYSPSSSTCAASVLQPDTLPEGVTCAVDAQHTALCSCMEGYFPLLWPEVSIAYNCTSGAWPLDQLMTCAACYVPTVLGLHYTVEAWGRNNPFIIAARCEDPRFVPVAFNSTCRRFAVNSAGTVPWEPALACTLAPSVTTTASASPSSMENAIWATTSTSSSASPTWSLSASVTTSSTISATMSPPKSYTPSFTPSSTPSWTASFTSSFTLTATPSFTPTATPSFTPTATSSVTPSNSPSWSPSTTSLPSASTSETASPLSQNVENVDGIGVTGTPTPPDMPGWITGCAAAASAIAAGSVTYLVLRGGHSLLQYRYQRIPAAE